MSGHEDVPVVVAKDADLDENGNSPLDTPIDFSEFEAVDWRRRCFNLAEVQDVRDRIVASGIQLRRNTDPVMIARVVEHVGDIEIAAEAILMEPRPQWVRTLIGADLMKVYPRA